MFFSVILEMPIHRLYKKGNWLYKVPKHSTRRDNKKSLEYFSNIATFHLG